MAAAAPCGRVTRREIECQRNPSFSAGRGALFPLERWPPPLFCGPERARHMPRATRVECRHLDFQPSWGSFSCIALSSTSLCCCREAREPPGVWGLPLPRRAPFDRSSHTALSRVRGAGGGGRRKEPTCRQVGESPRGLQEALWRRVGEALGSSRTGGGGRHVQSEEKGSCPLSGELAKPWPCGQQPALSGAKVGSKADITASLRAPMAGCGRTPQLPTADFTLQTQLLLS